MFPFDLIPASIDPKIRKIIITLVSIQFISFLVLMFILTYEHCSKKSENNKNTANDNKEEEEKQKQKSKNKTE